MKVYLNGRILEDDRAGISVRDAGFLYGYGLFETMRSYKGRIFLLEEHLKRLGSSAKFLKLKVPLSRAGLKDACYEVLKANHLSDARIRLSVSSGGPQGSTVLITAVPLKENELMKKRFRLLKAGFCIAQSSLLARHKTLNYLSNVYAYNQALSRGAEDAVFFTENGFLLETSRANIFLIKDGTLKTPSLALPILPGITRSKVIEIAQELRIKVKEGEFKEKDLRNADAVFLTNSIIEIAQVGSYEDNLYQDEDALGIVARIRENYQAQTSG